MSFGFSIGDLATLIALTKKTYDSWQQAPKEYADVVRTLSESKTLLCHVQNRFDALTTTGAGNDAAKQKEIEYLLRGCQSAISELRAVVKRRRKLGHWDRIRLGSSGHVHECRSRLARHINILTPFLFSLELESIGKDVGSLPAILDRLPQAVTNALPAALGKMIDERIEDSRTARGSIMTTYGDDDDKQAYRELRRNLRFFGIKDSVVRQQRAKLVEFIKTLTQGDHHTTEDESDGSDQIPEEQVVSVPSPSLVPLVFEAAEEVEIASEPLPGTRERRQYQAYAETEDEDDPTDSTVAEPRNGDMERKQENAKEPTVRSDEVNAADKTENGAKDTPDVPQGAENTPGVRGNDAARKGRRKYQAYVETEDEDDILETATRILSDSSVPVVSEVCVEESQTDSVIGAREDHLPSPKLDDDAPPPTPHANADGRPKPRKETPIRGPFKGPERPKTQIKPDRSSRRASSPAFAVCGDLEYQQCLESSSELEDSDSVAAHDSRNSYCSSCDQELTSGDEASWERLSVDVNYPSDFEWHSEADDDTSKIAHSGETDAEEDCSTRFSKGASARRPVKSQKRANREAEPNPFSPPPSSNVETGPPPRNPPQRMIEYKPLDASEEGLLTIQLHMPAGYSIHVEGGRIAQFHNPCVPNTWRQYFPTLPPNKGYHSNCVHGFPGAPLLGRTAWCNCQVFYWTPDLQYWNPTFVDGLRDWVKG